MAQKSLMEKYFLRHILLICLFFLIAHAGRAQTLSGKVVEEQSGKPLPFANVFISNTTLGSTTDKNGNYRISGKLPQNLELVVSFMGYYTKYRSIALSGRNYVTVNFELLPKENQLDEVQLKVKKDKKWERDLKRFERVFIALGDDPFIKENTITNPWLLDFDHGKFEGGTKYFSASAMEPLKIENSSLGYSIEYHLQEFIETRYGFFYKGLVNFNEMETDQEEQISDWEDKRNYTFHGSLRHFLLALLHRKPQISNYKLFEVIPPPHIHERTNVWHEELGNSIKPITQDSLYVCTLPSGAYMVALPGKIEIHNKKKFWINNYYTKIFNPISWLEAPLGYFVVDENGVLLDPSQLVISGNMARQRMARYLPHDFEPTGEGPSGLFEIDSVLLNINKWNSLREKPHITLNKSYYYPGEAVWLNARMMYQNTLFADTLSRTLYVDLYDRFSNKILEETFLIENGNASGLIKLPEDLKGDEYAIRAYTQWMRNYGEDEFTFSPLPVIDKNLRVIKNVDNLLFEEDDIEVRLSTEFRRDEWNNQANFEIRLTEGTEKAFIGEFSLSILDADKSQFLETHASLSQSMDWLNKEGKTIEYNEPVFPIEYGISVQGYFSDKKKKPRAVPITIVLGELEDYGILQSDTAGYFWGTGLNFQGEKDIAIAALNTKRKPYGSINKTVIERPYLSGYFPRLILETEEIKGSDTPDFDFLLGDGYFELDEFVLEERKKETMEDNNYGYGKGDRSIGPEFLESRPELTLDAVISMNMPAGGMGNYNWGLNAGEPLLIIDGARFFPSPDESVFAKLKSFIAAEVENIEVYTFSAPIFGMAGFAGAIVVRTKRGSRIQQEEERIFNAENFQLFKSRGFTPVPNFPTQYDVEKPVKAFTALYWNPNVKIESAQEPFSFSLSLPSSVKNLQIRIEGITEDGNPFTKVLSVKVD
ncbi:TonB-dependent receptor [Cyclobacteriaceae bacterium YHN15]|nr:TonB-dependent receptor [Cyclobacteriaceae bacterium YHN15]